MRKFLTPCWLLVAVFLVVVLLINGPAALHAQNSTKTSKSESATTETSEDSTKSKGFDFFDGKVPADIEQLREMQIHFRDLSQQVSDATVNVRVGLSQGSGVIVSRDGYIMTAAHVIGGSNRDAAITLPDGREVEGKTLGLNRAIDSGLVKITSPGKYPYLELGESSSLKPGQWVMAIGHPGGWDEDRGLVYRVGRVLQSSSRIIGTDCSLVGGDSGGPLVDMDGAVIGIHSRIGNRLRDNIHVPVDTYTETWEDLAKGRDWGSGVGGRNPANEPWIGFSLKNLSLEIEAVTDKGPAAKAGLKPGDVILEVKQTKIQSQFRLERVLSRIKPQDKIEIKYKRDDKETTVELTVGSRADIPDN